MGQGQEGIRRGWAEAHIEVGSTCMALGRMETPQKGSRLSTPWQQNTRTPNITTPQDLPQRLRHLRPLQLPLLTVGLGDSLRALSPWGPVGQRGASGWQQHRWLVFVRVEFGVLVLHPLAGAVLDPASTGDRQTDRGTE